LSVVSVLSGRGICDGLITRPEESYRLWRIVVYHQETSKTRKLKPATGLGKIRPQWVVTAGKQTTDVYAILHNLILRTASLKDELIIKIYKYRRGARGGVVVTALRYKPAGRGFDSRLCNRNFSVT
jgi:hypothetical protein